MVVRHRIGGKPGSQGWTMPPIARLSEEVGAEDAVVTWSGRSGATRRHAEAWMSRFVEN